MFNNYYLSSMAIFALSCIFSRYYGRRGSNMSVTSLFVITFTSIYNHNTSRQATFIKLVLFFRDCYFMDFSFYDDQTRFNFLFIVFHMCILIYFFTYSYLFTDKHLPRLDLFLSLFGLSMSMYVQYGTIPLSVMAWEVFGYISSTLISYWKNLPNIIFNAIKTFTINRIGDFAFCLGIFILFGNTIFFFIPYMSLFCLTNNTAIFVFLSIAMLSKSAQFPFFTWLYDAMSAPTPISSLLHAATMVTAGIFLGITMSSFTLLPNYKVIWLLFALLFACFTLIITSILSYKTYDIKRILAFSTSGQLAIISISLFTEIHNAAFYHLIMHAIFKTLVFLSIANIIHSVYDNQDTRYFGLSIFLVPITFIVLIIGSLSMISFPFSYGFYTKDYIIEFAFYDISLYALFAYITITLSVIFTTIYTIKLFSSISYYPSISYLNNIVYHGIDYLIFIIFVMLFLFSIISPIDLYSLYHNYSFVLYVNRSAIYYSTIIILPIMVSICTLYFIYAFAYDGIYSIIAYLISIKLSWDFINIRSASITVKYCYNVFFKAVEKYNFTYYLYPFKFIYSISNALYRTYNSNLYPLLFLIVSILYVIVLIIMFI